MNKSVLLIMAFICCTVIKAQEVIPLWDSESLTNNGLSGGDIVEREGNWIRNISVPELYIYKAKHNPTKKAVVICPGGGYGGVSIKNEGTKVAEWLNEKGITAVVLKYRMPNKHSNIPLADAQEAIKYVRKNADKLGIDPTKVGIAGFSAGGHLAATASTHYTIGEINTRPDFSILFYPVITMEVATTHMWTRKNLIGETPSTSDVHRFSNEKQVSVNTPPTILLLSDDDTAVVPKNSIDYYNALKNNNIPAAMYIFPEGGHGWGFGKEFKYHNQMTTLLEMWLNDLAL